MHVVSNAGTHVGRRTNNEDSFCKLDQYGLYVVADGMGGYEGGEVASKTVVQTLSRFFQRMNPSGEIGLNHETGDYSLAKSRFDIAIRMAHREIIRRRTPELKEMGSTLAAVVIQHGRALIAHVGDSRVYRIRHEQIEQMTIDHSLYAELEAAGAVPLPPRKQCSFQHVITRALGVDGDARADFRVEPLEAGDLFLVVSDGLTDVVSDDQIQDCVGRSNIASLPARLIRQALSAGAKDNITVAAVSILP